MEHARARVLVLSQSSRMRVWLSTRESDLSCCPSTLLNTEGKGKNGPLSRTLQILDDKDTAQTLLGTRSDVAVNLLCQVCALLPRPLLSCPCLHSASPLLGTRPPPTDTPALQRPGVLALVLSSALPNACLGVHQCIENDVLTPGDAFGSAR